MTWYQKIQAKNPPTLGVFRVERNRVAAAELKARFVEKAAKIDDMVTQGYIDGAVAIARKRSVDEELKGAGKQYTLSDMGKRLGSALPGALKDENGKTLARTHSALLKYVFEDATKTSDQLANWISVDLDLPLEIVNQYRGIPAGPAIYQPQPPTTEVQQPMMTQNPNFPPQQGNPFGQPQQVQPQQVQPQQGNPFEQPQQAQPQQGNPFGLPQQLQQAQPPQNNPFGLPQQTGNQAAPPTLAPANPLNPFANSAGSLTPAEQAVGAHNPFAGAARSAHPGPLTPPALVPGIAPQQAIHAPDVVAAEPQPTQQWEAPVSPAPAIPVAQQAAQQAPIPAHNGRVRVEVDNFSKEDVFLTVVKSGDGVRIGVYEAFPAGGAGVHLLGKRIRFTGQIPDELIDHVDFQVE